jgi:hypothetical protein
MLVVRMAISEVVIARWNTLSTVRLPPAYAQVLNEYVCSFSGVTKTRVLDSRRRTLSPLVG